MEVVAQSQAGCAYLIVPALQDTVVPCIIDQRLYITTVCEYFLGLDRHRIEL